MLELNQQNITRRHMCRCVQTSLCQCISIYLQRTSEALLQGPLRRILVVSNFFLSWLRPLGSLWTLQALEMVLYPWSDLYLITILLWNLKFLRLHCLFFVLTCIFNCGTTFLCNKKQSIYELSWVLTELCASSGPDASCYRGLHKPLIPVED